MELPLRGSLAGRLWTTLGVSCCLALRSDGRATPAPELSCCSCVTGLANKVFAVAEPFLADDSLVLFDLVCDGMSSSELEAT